METPAHTIKVDFYPFWQELHGKHFSRTFDTVETWHRVKAHLNQPYLAMLVFKKEGDNWQELQEESFTTSLFSGHDHSYMVTPQPIP